jgi:hypothetical protein
MPRHLRFALALAGVLVVAGPAYAQSPSEVNLAKQTAGEGLAAYQAGEFDKALGLFNQARKIYPSAQILRMIGYSELALDHWVKTIEALEAALDAKITPLSKEDRKDVQDQMAKALVHVGAVTVSSKVPHAQLTIDGGEPHALPLDKPIHLLEGAHKLVVTAPDRLDAVNDVKVEGGKPLEVALEPAPKPVAPPPPPPLPPPPLAPVKPERRELVPNQRLLGFGAAGAGVAFGGAALVTLIEWLHWRSLAKSDVAAHNLHYGPNCSTGDPRLCAFDIAVTNKEADTADQLRNAAAGLGVTAAVLAATGVVFVVLAPSAAGSHPTEPAQARLFPLPAAPVSVRCGAGGGLGLLCSGAF